jgi:hypothetical protein
MSNQRKPPLHERIRLLGWLRGIWRRRFFDVARQASETDDARAIAAKTLQGLLDPKPGVWDGLGAYADPPYEELGKPRPEGRTALRDDSIFITARFRSGSTLLWNLFRNLEGCTSYYEPLNERRWFDPATRGKRVDKTHRNVEDYWKEYDGLEVLDQYYHESWTHRSLLMDPTFWDADLKRYVGLLIERAPGRPVLQFNRIDFRLPWFRLHFPAARIIHLYRHPRDQWCSSLLDVKSFPKDGKVADFARHDHFYLLSWARDLRYHFPFLDERSVSHPYQLFYYIWKLSYQFGRKYAHHSLAFEHLVDDPDTQLPRLFDAVAVKGYDLDRVKRVIVKTGMGKWKQYADDNWFRRHEAACEDVLAEFFGAAVG